MKYLKPALCTLGLLIALNAPSRAEDGKMAIAHLLNPQGEKIGVATLTEGSEGVTIVAHVHSLTPGPHAFHIHSVGKAEAPSFKSSGGHFNPYGKGHGLKNPNGRHAGDLSNLQVGSDGVGTTVVLASLVTLEEGANSLFDEDGSAIVIHAGADDNNPKDDPQNKAGNAGARVACGVIKMLQ
jgi:Cu-Zn family superoxide dismutase